MKKEKKKAKQVKEKKKRAKKNIINDKEISGKIESEEIPAKESCCL